MRRYVGVEEEMDLELPLLEATYLDIKEFC